MVRKLRIKLPRATVRKVYLLRYNNEGKLKTFSWFEPLTHTFAGVQTLSKSSITASGEPEERREEKRCDREMKGEEG